MVQYILDIFLFITGAFWTFLQFVRIFKMFIIRHRFHGAHKWIDAWFLADELTFDKIFEEPT